MVGEQVERAIRMLNALEIRFEVIEVFDETHPAGEVLSSSIEADSVVYRTTDVVTLRVAKS